MGCVVIGSSTRYKNKYDKVRGEVIGYPGFVHAMVKVKLLSGAAEGTLHDYKPENLTAESSEGVGSATVHTKPVLEKSAEEEAADLFPGADLDED